MKYTPLALLMVGGLAVAEPLPIDDAALVRQMPGAGIEYRLPERVFPPELIELLRHGDPVYRKLLYRSVPNQVGLWTSIPIDAWEKLISDFAPISVEGNTGNPNTMGKSPFTGDYFGGVEMSREDFLAHPFQARERGTDFVIYAREEDMPADYPARPNRTVRIPHLDGTTYAYRFHVPAAYAEAGPELGSDRKHWFCPAGEVWRARMGVIFGEAVHDLVAAVILDDNREAVTTLAAILDRVATVYAGLPVYGGAKAHGIARNRAGTDYLTTEEYRSIAPEQPFIDVRDRDRYPFWYRDIYDFSFAKLHYGVSAWTDGVMDNMGWVASAFDLVRDLPETRAYSQARYGDPDAWEKRFRERCLPELEFLALATPPTTGNTSYAYITGSVKVGIATGNAALFSKGPQIIELYLYNNWLPDGMAADAAFNYAMMTQAGILGLGWLNGFFGGVDLADRYPLKRRIDELGPNPVVTLFGIVSKHADQHAWIFRSSGPGPDPAALPYADHQAGMCLPNYGMSVLRGGRPGNRVELVFDHQNAPQHAHFSRLNYQLFHDGVDCLPDFGYTIGYIDPDKSPWDTVTTDYELLGLPSVKTDRWGPWKWAYSDRPEAHNVVMVDDWLYQSVPCQLHGFAGAAGPDDPGWWAQFADADDASLFVDRPNPVDVCRRQVALVTLPNGAPVVVDITRVLGGRKHDVFWHVPGDTPELPGPVEAIDAPNLAEYFGQRLNYDKVTGKTTRFYGIAGRLITGLVRHPLPATAWTEAWAIQPARTFPQPAERRAYGNWETLLHDVRMDMWTAVSGSPATGELIAARGPWPGFLAVVDPETGKETRQTVGLKDALDYRIISRTADEPGLETSVVRVIETRRPDDTPSLASVQVGGPLPIGSGGGVIARLDLADGATGFVGSTLDGQTVQNPDFTLRGRLGVALPATGQMAVYDGTHLRAAGWAVELAPSWAMTLVGVEGDLTGQPLASALIVTSPTPLPTDGTLVGQQVYVWHQVSSHLQTVYTIAGIEALPGGRWRLSLAYSPPFILQRARVLKIDAEDRHKMTQTFQFQILNGPETAIQGRRIRFPRTGFETALLSCTRADFTVAEAPSPDEVAPGDPFVVYTVQAGDRVTLPNFFAMSGTREGDGWLLDLKASGPVTLTVPGRFAAAVGKVPVPTQPAGDATRVELPPAALTDGRGALQLIAR